MPPDDMWQQLDKIVTETGTLKIPDNSFCRADIMEHYNIDRNVAYKRIRNMLDNGSIKAIGRFGNKTYYQLVKP